MKTISLPAVVTGTSGMLQQVTQAFGVRREVLASDKDIGQAWNLLPEILTKIPPELRDEQRVRMCVAVAAGLFDSAVNYAWNSAIPALRQKVTDFGLHVVRQITGNKDFDEKALGEFKDAQLLDLCLSLNLITEDGHFFLSQCREVRNNFSCAHPPLGSLGHLEFLTFFDRGAKHALASAPANITTAAVSARSTLA